MNKREARIRALEGLTAAASLAAGGMGDAFPQYNDALGEWTETEWTETEEQQLRAAFAALHLELVERLERLGRR